MGVCFTFALLAEKLGYSAALGAFIGGVLVAESGLGKKVEHAAASVRDIFAAVFFVSIGMSVDPSVAWKTLPVALLVLACVVVAQFLSVTIGGVLSGSGVRRSVTAGLALGQIGEFAFIIVSIGVAAKVVGAELYSVLVSVAVLSTFSTAFFLRRREVIARGVERVLPDRLRRLLAMYEAWFDDMRSSRGSSGTGVGRAFSAIFVDLVLMMAVLAGWRTWEEEVGTALVEFFGVSTEVGQTLSTAGLFAALLPLLVPLIWGIRQLSVRLSTRVFGAEPSSAKAFLRTTLSLSIVTAIGVPGTLLLGQVVGVTYVWPALFAVLALIGTIAWRKLRLLDDDIQSGGFLLVRAIADQGMPEAERESIGSPLAGFTNVREVVLKGGDFAIGKSLANLQLRSFTGASVVAMKHEGSVALPEPTAELALGDTLMLAGCAVDKDAAAEFLSQGPTTEQDGVPRSRS